MAICPNEWFAFLSEVEEWAREFRISFDKSSIEVAKSQELLDVFYCFRSWPLSDGFQLDGVHA